MQRQISHLFWRSQWAVVGLLYCLLLKELEAPCKWPGQLMPQCSGHTHQVKLHYIHMKAHQSLCAGLGLTGLVNDIGGNTLRKRYGLDTRQGARRPGFQCCFWQWFTKWLWACCLISLSCLQFQEMSVWMQNTRKAYQWQRWNSKFSAPCLPVLCLIH